MKSYSSKIPINKLICGVISLLMCGLLYGSSLPYERQINQQRYTLHNLSGISPYFVLENSIGIDEIFPWVIRWSGKSPSSQNEYVFQRPGAPNLYLGIKQGGSGELEMVEIPDTINVYGETDVRSWARLINDEFRYSYSSQEGYNYIPNGTYISKSGEVFFVKWRIEETDNDSIYRIQNVTTNEYLIVSEDYITRLIPEENLSQEDIDNQIAHWNLNEFPWNGPKLFDVAIKYENHFAFFSQANGQIYNAYNDDSRTMAFTFFQDIDKKTFRDNVIIKVDGEIVDYKIPYIYDDIESLSYIIVDLQVPKFNKNVIIEYEMQPILSTVTDDIVISDSVLIRNITGTPGDFNGDGVLNVLDISSLIDYILPKPADYEHDPALLQIVDMNDDGTIDVLDYVIMVQIIVDQPLP